MKQILQNKMMVVVSNREPYMHVHAGREINMHRAGEWDGDRHGAHTKSLRRIMDRFGKWRADRETVDKNDKVKCLLMKINIPLRSDLADKGTGRPLLLWFFK